MWFQLHEGPRGVQVLEAESGMAVLGVLGRRNEGLFHGFRVSVLQEAKSSGVRLCNSVNALNSAEWSTKHG